MKLVNKTLNSVVCTRLFLARTIWSRTRGLIGRPPLGPGEGLLIEPCQAVHTFFMRYPLDLAFLDESYRVVALRASLRPWRMTRYHRDAVATLELAAGELERLGLEVEHVLGVVEDGAA